MPLNKPSCRFSICNHLFQFLRGHSKSRPPGEFPYEPFKTLNHSHISYHGSPASVFSVWWCNPFARSAGKFLQVNLRFAAFFKIYQILKLTFLKFDKILQIFRHLQFFLLNFLRKLLIFQTDFLRKFWDCSGAKGCKSFRAWKMLSNAYFLAKFRFDTAENEPAKKLQNLLILPP